jgi:hypothetical protein
MTLTSQNVPSHNTTNKGSKRGNRTDLQCHQCPGRNR